MLRITTDGTQSFSLDDNGNVIFLKTTTIDELQLTEGLTGNQHTFTSNDRSILIKASSAPRSNPTTGKMLCTNCCNVELGISKVL